MPPPPPPPPAPAPAAQHETVPRQPTTSEQVNADPSMSSAELSAIRSRYLGVDKKKRQIRKMSDRKFVFDWSEHDDTFSSDSPSAVGGARQGAAVMFGRGHLAGMDPDAAHAAHAAIPSGGRLSSLGDRKKGVVDERHWSEKPPSEMKERDWRIFREDFSISARGTFFPLVPPELTRTPLKVAKFRPLFDLGTSHPYRLPYSTSLRLLDTKNPLLSNARRFPSVFRIAISLGLRKQVSTGIKFYFVCPNLSYRVW